jgi:hypothetical protein
MRVRGRGVCPTGSGQVQLWASICALFVPAFRPGVAVGVPSAAWTRQRTSASPQPRHAPRRQRRRPSPLPFLRRRWIGPRPARGQVLQHAWSGIAGRSSGPGVDGRLPAAAGALAAFDAHLSGAPSGCGRVSESVEHGQVGLPAGVLGVLVQAHPFPTYGEILEAPVAARRRPRGLARCVSAPLNRARLDAPAAPVPGRRPR